MWQARVNERGREEIVVFVRAGCEADAKRAARGALAVYRCSARARRVWLAQGERVCPPGTPLAAA